jgi:hypothetical protein
VLLKERLILIGISRVTPYDKATQDHVRGSSGKKDLMVVFRFPCSFDDDVGVLLEEGDYFLRCRDLLTLEDSPVGLIDDLTENTDSPLKSSGQFMSVKGIGEGMTFIGGKFGDCLFGVPYHLPGIIEEILVRALTYRILAGIENCHDPLLYYAPVVAELITGLRDEFLALGKPTGNDADAVGEKSRVCGVVDVGFYGC